MWRHKNPFNIVLDIFVNLCYKDWKKIARLKLKQCRFSISIELRTALTQLRIYKLPTGWKKNTCILIRQSKFISIYAMLFFNCLLLASEDHGFVTVSHGFVYCHYLRSLKRRSHRRQLYKIVREVLSVIVTYLVEIYDERKNKINGMRHIM